MTRYSVSSRRPSRRAEPIHAIWRGIGCLLILIVPVIAWLLAVATVKLALQNGWSLPYQLLGYPVIPDTLWKIAGAPPILAFIQRQENLYLILALTVVFIIMISGVLSLAYSFIYRLAGPPRYGPLDVPQPQIKVGRYKR